MYHWLISEWMYLIFGFNCVVCSVYWLTAPAWLKDLNVIPSNDLKWGLLSVEGEWANEYTIERVRPFQLLEYHILGEEGVLTKLSRPPSLCHQCTPAVFLGSINTCCNRNGYSQVQPGTVRLAGPQQYEKTLRLIVLLPIALMLLHYLLFWNWLALCQNSVS